jgi:hypothetical protein
MQPACQLGVGSRVARDAGVISSEVRDKLEREQRRVLNLLYDLRAAAEAGDRVELAQRATRLQQSLDAHLALVAYVLESLADDDAWDEDLPPEDR